MVSKQLVVLRFKFQEKRKYQTGEVQFSSSTVPNRQMALKLVFLEVTECII